MDCVSAITRLKPGRSYPLGATLRAGGANFSVFAKHATAVELLPLRSRGRQRARPHHRARSAPPSHLSLLARVRAGDRGRPGLWLSRAWPVRTGTGSALRPRQAAARPLRSMRRRAGGAQPPSRDGAGRQRGDGAEERRRRSAGLRLGGRPAATSVVREDRDLRDARRQASRAIRAPASRSIVAAPTRASSRRSRICRISA